MYISRLCLISGCLCPAPCWLWWWRSFPIRRRLVMREWKSWCVVGSGLLIPYLRRHNAWKMVSVFFTSLSLFFGLWFFPVVVGWFVGAVIDAFNLPSVVHSHTALLVLSFSFLGVYASRISTLLALLWLIIPWPHGASSDSQPRTVLLFSEMLRGIRFLFSFRFSDLQVFRRCSSYSLCF